MKKLIRRIDILFAFILTIIYSAVAVGTYSLPSQISQNSDNKIVFNKIYTVNTNNEKSVDYQNASPVSTTNAQINLFGVIPVKNTEIVNDKDLGRVYVSGESFGIKLYTDGAIIVGMKDVETESGKINPAQQSGLQKGDIIIGINGKRVTNAYQVEEIFNSGQKEYKIKVKRDGGYKSFVLKPALSKPDGLYKIGLWVRDSTAGIGTVTFYNPSNNTVAALGHPITDVDTNEIMPILNGEAVKASVTKLYKSKNGEAGSLCCDFSNNVIGTLNTNNISGIYGKYICQIDNLKDYQVAMAQEVERGDAKIICTVDENGPREYDVQIVRVSYRDNNEKNMVIRVTDKRLLELTGGIVQGMSGSPIIQNGKLVGALTHVIVDNPEKGYAIFAEKMVKTSLNVE